jgi:hypothetical protein
VTRYFKGKCHIILRFLALLFSVAISILHPIIVSFVKVKPTQIGASFFTPNKYPHNYKQGPSMTFIILEGGPSIVTLGALKRAFGWLKYGS